MQNRIILFFLILLSTNLAAQKAKKVQLIHADVLRGMKVDGQELNILIGDVRMKQDSTLFYCDSAVMNKEDNNFDAYGNVHVNISDSAHIYGDVLNYTGEDRIARIHYNVVLEDNDATLYTDHLTYYRLTGIALYTTGGKIISDENILTSKKGYYYSEIKEMYFKDSVVLTNPDYVMNGDTLKYNTETEVAYIFGPTTVVGDEEFLYSEDGWYDTQNDIARLKQNSYIIYNENSLKGDSIYYDRFGGYGLAFSNVELTDTVKDVVITGELSEYFKFKRYAYVTDSAIAKVIDGNDTLFLNADTLMLTFDTAQEMKNLHAFYNTRYFREDLQGSSDSLVYFLKDSVIVMYQKPVIWNGENQLTADSIKVFISNSSVDSVGFFSSAFIASQDDTSYFNQIKGKNMMSYFRDGELRKIIVSGNSETIYFVREEDDDLMGVNKALASNMIIYLVDKEVDIITYIEEPKATLFPIEEIAEQDMVLRGFDWLDDIRPRSKYDIFKLPD